MKATVTFEREIKEIPKNCMTCPFVDACDTMIHGITKSGNRWTAAAQRGRIRKCTLKVEEQ